MISSRGAFLEESIHLNLRVINLHDTSSHLEESQVTRVRSRTFHVTNPTQGTYIGAENRGNNLGGLVVTFGFVLNPYLSHWQSRGRFVDQLSNVLMLISDKRTLFIRSKVLRKVVA